MSNRAVIEVTSVHERNQSAQLIRCAYRASQTGLVALVLNGVDARAVDRVLDPIVPFLSLTIPGVRYLSIDDDALVQEAVLSASYVFVATKRFRSAALGFGVDRSVMWPLRSALMMLGEDTVQEDMPFPTTWFQQSAISRLAGAHFPPAFGG